MMRFNESRTISFTLLCVQMSMCVCGVVADYSSHNCSCVCEYVCIANVCALVPICVHACILHLCGAGYVIV